MRPYIRRWKTGGLGLGGLGQFDEASLAQKQAQLMQLRQERAQLEAEIQSVKTGIPLKPAVARAGAIVELPPAEEEGIFAMAKNVPTWAWLAAGAGLLFVLRRKKAS